TIPFLRSHFTASKKQFNQSTLSATSCTSTLQAIMVKIHLVASAALVLCAGVCSALDLYSDINYQGTLCRFATPAGNCFSIPEPCYRSVKSATIHQGWLCQLHSEDGCEGIWKDIKQDTTALPDSDWKSVACWTAPNDPRGD
ncbi:hypothetical protein BGX31_000984, partial [Mortierella sp. GBA43]